MSRMKTLEEWKKQSVGVHGETYNYDKATEIGSLTKVDIICREHGVFSQMWSEHVRGRGCPSCGNVKQGTAKLLSIDELKQKASSVHGDRYGYEAANAVGMHNKVTITCKDHGGFTQSWSNHISGRGCPTCARVKLTSTASELKGKSILVHGDRYGYDKADKEGASSKVDILCREHGYFTQSWEVHTAGHGCPKCGTEAGAAKISVPLGDNIANAIKAHGGEYSYDKAEGDGTRHDVTITCKKHGDFRQSWNNHILSGTGCPKCANIGPSKQETELADWVESLGFKVDRNRRDLLGNGKEVDIFVPAINLCIEYNGIYHHMRHPKKYHQDKTKSAMKNGYRMIHIFDDQWIKKPEHVKGILRLALGKPIKILHARNLVVDPKVSSEEARSFLSDNHIYEFSGASVKLGLRSREGDLVSLMTFGYDRFGGKHKHGYELIRFANLQGCSIVGGAKKLHDYFLKEWKPWSISCYADASLFEGAAYTNLGYENHGITRPNNWYMYRGKRAHRMGYTKVKLKSRFDVDCDDDLTAHENVIKHLKLQFLWDCGSWKLTWNSA